MNQLSIRTRVLILALLPLFALTAFLTFYNFEGAAEQSRSNERIHQFQKSALKIECLSHKSICF